MVPQLPPCIFICLQSLVWGGSEGSWGQEQSGHRVWGLCTNTRTRTGSLAQITQQCGWALCIWRSYTEFSSKMLCVVIVLFCVFFFPILQDKNQNPRKQPSVSKDSANVALSWLAWQLLFLWSQSVNCVEVDFYILTFLPCFTRGMMPRNTARMLWWLPRTEWRGPQGAAWQQLGWQMSILVPGVTRYQRLLSKYNC